MREEADKRLTRTHAPLIQTWSITQRIWKLRYSLKSSIRTCPLQLSERSCRSCEPSTGTIMVSWKFESKTLVLFRDSIPFFFFFYEIRTHDLTRAGKKGKPLSQGVFFYCFFQKFVYIYE